MTNQQKPQYVLDTSCMCLIHKDVVDWEEGDFITEIGHLMKVEKLIERGEVYCIPQVIEELTGMERKFRSAIGRFNGSKFVRSFVERFERINQICESSVYDWQKEKGETAQIARYAHHWTRIHNRHTDKTKFGGRLETDKHLMTTTIVRGLYGEAWVVTNDMPLIASFRDVYVKTVQGGGLEVRFPYEVGVLHMLRDEKPRQKGSVFLQVKNWTESVK